MRKKLTLFAVCLASVVVVLGAFTRLTDAGLGCPDWPGCYGFLAVPSTEAAIAEAEAAYPHAPVEAHKAWAEMVHRYFATTLGFVIVVLAVLFVRARRESHREPFRLPLFLLALVILQGAFGAWTVTLKLWPQVVTAHLLGGFTTLSLLWLLYLRQSDGLGGRWTVPHSAGTLALVLLVVVFVQIALGGWVSSNYAALACPDFPTCHGLWLPPTDFHEGFNVFQDVGPNYLGGQMENDARVTIQWVHRLGALTVFVLGTLLCLRLYRAGSRFAGVLALALATQITLGILNVVLTLPLTIATLHNAGGALVLLVMVTVNYRAFRARRA